MGASLNNLLVDALRRGHVPTVDALAALGHGPSALLDWVLQEEDPFLASSPARVATRPVWFWVHQAPTPQASRRCWEAWLRRELEGLDERRRTSRLDALLAQALGAAVSSGHARPAWDTWEQMERFAGDMKMTWGHQAMAVRLGACLAETGDIAADFLVETHHRGLVSEHDVAAWGQDPDGAWDVAAARAHPVLLQALLIIHDQPAPRVMARLRDKVLAQLATLLEQGPGAWDMENHGQRLLECHHAICAYAPAAGPVPVALEDQMDRVIAQPQAWSSPTICALKELRLESSFQDSAPAPRNKARM